MMKSWLSSNKNAMEPFFFAGKGQGKRARPQRSGRSVGVFLVCNGERMHPKAAAKKVTAAFGMGIWGTARLRFPQSKGKLPCGSSLLNYCAIASVWASVKKKAFVINIASCSSSSSFFGFLVVCFHIIIVAMDFSPFLTCLPIAFHPWYV